MEVSAEVKISGKLEDVWKTVTDIKNCKKVITGIVDLEILNESKDTLIGLKWKETRVMFGQGASEIMWITDYKEGEFYQTRAESHGSVYETKISLNEFAGIVRLTMNFSGKPQKLFAKVLYFLTGFLMKGSVRKALLKDLSDIKRYVEEEL